MSNKPTSSLSGTLRNTDKEEEDVSCWNCFITNSEHEMEPVPLYKIREEQRTKFKLYSFFASNLSKPKTVSLKQKVSQHYSVAKKLDEKTCRNSGVQQNLQDNMEVDESENKQYLAHKLISSISQTSNKSVQNFSSRNIRKTSQSAFKRDKSTKTDINITITKLTTSDSSSSSSTTPDFRPRRKILAKPKLDAADSNKNEKNYYKSVPRDYIDSDIIPPNLIQKYKAASLTEANIAQKLIEVENLENRAKVFSDPRIFVKNTTHLSELKISKIPSQKKRDSLSIGNKSSFPETNKMISPKTLSDNIKQGTDTLKQNLKELPSIDKPLENKILSTKHIAAIDTNSSHYDEYVPKRAMKLKQILNECYTIDKKLDETIAKYADLTESKTKSLNIELEKSKPQTEMLQNKIYSNNEIVAKPSEQLVSDKETNIENVSPNKSTQRLTNISYKTYEFNENKAFVNENIDNFNKTIERRINTSTPKTESKIYSTRNVDVFDSVTNDIDDIIEKCANLSLAEKSKDTVENIKSITLPNESLKVLEQSPIIGENNEKSLSPTIFEENKEAKIISSKSPSITPRSKCLDLKNKKYVSNIPVKILEKKDIIDRTLMCTDKVDNVSYHGSESGYAGSSGTVQDFHENEVKKETAEKTVKKGDSLKVSSTGNLKGQQFKSSLPALNNIFDKKNFKTTSISKSLNIDINKAGSKWKQWSTLSVSSKPLSLQDDVYASDTLSSGNATLPRRSSSPLPHDRDLDRDRFPINRSGLQARSESMASVYSGAGEGARGCVAVRGEVQFSLLYNYRLGALEVGVKRCRDLAPVDTKRNRSDPYVKVYLLPDKSKAGKRKTKVKKNTLNPVFEETLSFVQPLASLSARTLWLSVWHADMFGRNDFLGEVALPLADVVFDDPAPTWYRLHERTEHFDEQQGTRGDLIIGLKFESQDNSSRGKGTLHVLVKEAKNLVATKPNGLADVFCKSYLLPERGRLAKQKTNVVRRTLNPRWEHTFTYRGLTMQELATRALELSLWDRDRLASNDFMGAIRLSLGTGTYMGASVNWMDSMGKEVALWQTMMQRPNFWVEGSLPLRPQLNN